MSKEMRCAHVLPDLMPVLASTFAKLIVRNFSQVMFFLKSYYVWGNEKIARAKNEGWTKELPNCTYLSLAWIRQLRLKLKGPLSTLFSVCFFDLSLGALIKLLMGPRYIVFHGYSSNWLTLLLLRLCGKKLILIYWGGRLIKKGWAKPIASLQYKCYAHIFVLMSPEIDYFKALGCKRVELLSYPNGVIKDWKFDGEAFKEMQKQKTILLGNSVHHREEYHEILEKLSPTDWERVTCMLNYGREDDTERTKDFIATYQARFGQTFYPWETIHPYAEYLECLVRYPIYVYAGKGQGGVGAISASIRQGKTLLLRGDNLKWVRALGCKVYDIDEITDWSAEGLRQLLLTEAQAKANFDAYYHAYTHEFSEENWVKRIRRCIGADAPQVD